MFETAKHINESSVKIYKHIYISQDEELKAEEQEIVEQWFIEMKPFREYPPGVGLDPTPEQQRKVTDKTIKRMVDVVKEYLSLD